MKLWRVWTWAFKEYGNSLDTLGALKSGSPPDETVQELIRDSGKKMVDFSSNLLNQSRNKVAQAANKALRWPLISMGLILIIFILGAFLVNRKVVNPLVELEKATEKIGRGISARSDIPPVSKARWTG